MHVRFGDHDVPVPEPLGVILTELIRTGRTHAASRLGIYAMAGRRAALTDLAAQLPAAGVDDVQDVVAVVQAPVAAADAQNPGREPFRRHPALGRV